jgi:hypothetical protein
MPRNIISRIHLRPKFISLSCLFQVAGEMLIVMRIDVKPLPLTDPVAQLVPLLGILHRQAALAEIFVDRPKLGMAKFGSSWMARWR